SICPNPFSELISKFYKRGKHDMGNKFLRIDDHQSLEDVISNSSSQPVVIFKHSNSCPISSRAYREMEQFDGPVNLVEVQAARDISRKLADITGVRHETPQ